MFSIEVELNEATRILLRKSIFFRFKRQNKKEKSQSCL